jgi:alpha-D-ribose 1-methylphosphonate 5-triphosphate synthase subunit PhnL
MATPLVVSEVAKSFTMHLRDGIKLPVVSNVSFSVAAGECVVLGGPSGIGKSSLLKMIYGNYAVDSGQILVKHQDRLVDLATADPRTVHRRPPPHARLCQPVPAHRAACRRHRRRRRTAGRPWRRRPRPPAKRQPNCSPSSTCRKLSGSCRPPPSPAASSSASTSPAASSPSTPILLLDEPTASLDAKNRAVVVEMIAAKKKAGVALLGIFHDEEVREAVADRILDVTRPSRPEADRSMSRILSESTAHPRNGGGADFNARPLHQDRRPRAVSRVRDRRLFLCHAGWHRLVRDDRQVFNIAASVRINATNHPTWRPTLHHFTYRAGDYWDDVEHDERHFSLRAPSRASPSATTPGSATAATILPGVTVGNGAASAPARSSPRMSRPIRSSAACPPSRSASASRGRSASAWTLSPGGIGTTTACASPYRISAR